MTGVPLNYGKLAIALLNIYSVFLAFFILKCALSPCSGDGYTLKLLSSFKELFART